MIMLMYANRYDSPGTLTVLHYSESELYQKIFCIFIVKEPNPKKSIIKGDNWSNVLPCETMHRLFSKRNIFEDAFFWRRVNASETGVIHLTKS